MKKTNKENPLTFFRKANESRQKVVKNSLAKARFGQVVNSVVPSPPPVVAGPQTEIQSIMSNARNSQPPIPYANKPSREEMMKQRMMESRPNVDTVNQLKSDKSQSRSYGTNTTPGEKFNPPMKKGGSIKRKK